MRKAGRISYVSFAGGRVAIAGDTEDLGARALTPEMCNRVARFRAAFFEYSAYLPPRKESPRAGGSTRDFFLGRRRTFTLQCGAGKCATNP